ncbi:hypothetical protein F4819DRAFT_448499 [Hypoxylon fuscum]|nr:hypothetical protein F4819DRAFT_448499 [Hypoxylon fuscum]
MPGITTTMTYTRATLLFAALALLFTKQAHASWQSPVETQHMESAADPGLDGSSDVSNFTIDDNKPAVFKVVQVWESYEALGLHPPAAAPGEICTDCEQCPHRCRSLVPTPEPKADPEPCTDPQCSHRRGTPVPAPGVKDGGGGEECQPGEPCPHPVSTAVPTPQDKAYYEKCPTGDKECPHFRGASGPTARGREGFEQCKDGECS